MKTLLIATDETLNAHAGEEYDDYMVFKSFIGIDSLKSAANLIRNKIREMALNGDEIKITVDTTPPYHVMLVSLADVMKSEEGIKIILPEFLLRSNEPKTLD